MSKTLSFDDWLALTQLYADYAECGRLGQLGSLARVLHRRLRLPPAAAREP